MGMVCGDATLPYIKSLNEELDIILFYLLMSSLLYI